MKHTPQQIPPHLLCGPPMQRGLPPMMKPYYPFTGQPSAYPYAFPYQYAPPPPYFYLMNKGAYPPMPFNYQPDHILPNYRPTRQLLKSQPQEVTDVDKIPLIKQEYIQGDKIKQNQPRARPVQNKSPRKNQKTYRKVQIQNSEEQEVKVFELTQIFKRMLTSLVKSSANQSDVKRQISNELRERGDFEGKQQFFEQLYDVLKEKFEHFRKTKEQLIKYIIRRTYHNAKHRKNSTSFRLQLQKLEQFHQKNIRHHKSMNNEFLKKEFSNKVFLHFYQEFLEQTDDQFDRQNSEKTQKFASVIASSWISQNMSIIVYEKKVPWSYHYKLKIKTLAKQLLSMHKPLIQKEKPQQEIE